MDEPRGFGWAQLAVVTAMVVACVIGTCLRFRGFGDFDDDIPEPPPVSIDGRYCSNTGDVVVVTGHRFTAVPLSPRFADLIHEVVTPRARPSTGAGRLDWGVDGEDWYLNLTVERLNAVEVPAVVVSFTLFTRDTGLEFAAAALEFTPCGKS